MLEAVTQVRGVFMLFIRKLLSALLATAVAGLAPAWNAAPVYAQVGGIGVPAMPARPTPVTPRFSGDGSGTLQVLTPDGKSLICPLKHTDVHADVSGYISRVTVKQLFGNPYKNKIEAVYTFPLSDTGAVDDMTMRVGSRTIHGTIKKREEAQQIYNDAKNQGHVASLLNQERPNVFTQSVANIEPGKDVEVTLSYVDLLPYQDGEYSFAFPTVVGPRFNPGTPTGREGLGFSPDTDQVPDASKITPHVAPDGVRAGHDISISVAIDAGVPIGAIASKLHEIKIQRAGDSHAEVTLAQKETIPNKDFVMSWAVASDSLHSGYLTNGSKGSGYFTMMILPPKKAAASQIQPKEMIFVIDCSGSQRGLPIQKAKEAMEYSLDHMNPNDTFQVITFNNSVTRLFLQPRPANDEMRRRAKDFVKGLEANGGTWMAPAIEAACKEPTDSHRLRIVSFMTDGFIGNDFEVVGLVKKLRDNSRWFPFGTGNSVNRFLIDNIAKAGGGEADYVYLNSDAAAVGKKFYDEIASPVLTDIKVDFGGLDVKEVFPHEISDVWAQRPLYITGRYLKPGSGTVTVSGFSGGKPYKQTLAVTFPESNSANAVLGSIWARAKVDRLMEQDYGAAQTGNVNPELKDEITKVALEHHIMTQYTSFVAVEEKRVTTGGASQTVEVPVELPQGVSRDGVFGDELLNNGVHHIRRGPAGRAMIMHGNAAAGGGGGSGASVDAASLSGLKKTESNKVASKYPMAFYSSPRSAAVTTAIGGSLAQANQFAPQAASLSPVPPPVAIASPVPMAQPANQDLRASRQYMRHGSPAGSSVHQRYMHANEKMIADRELQAAGADKPLSDNERKEALTKLPESLKKFIDARGDNGKAQIAGISTRGTSVFVKITVKDPTGNFLQVLYVPNLDIQEVVAGDGFVFAFVDANFLLELAAKKNVVKIEPATPTL